MNVGDVTASAVRLGFKYRSAEGYLERSVGTGDARKRIRIVVEESEVELLALVDLGTHVGGLCWNVRFSSGTPHSVFVATLAVIMGVG